LNAFSISVANCFVIACLLGLSSPSGMFLARSAVNFGVLVPLEAFVWSLAVAVATGPAERFGGDCPFARTGLVGHGGVFEVWESAEGIIEAFVGARGCGKFDAFDFCSSSCFFWETVVAAVGTWVFEGVGG
jgi:hypothetical protein